MELDGTIIFWGNHGPNFLTLPLREFRAQFPYVNFNISILFTLQFNENNEKLTI